MKTKFYRGGGTGEIIKGLSAYDVIEYEKAVLGNTLNVLLTNKALKNINSYNLKWLCIDKHSARAYGKPETVFISNYRVIASDNYNGVLLEVLR